MRILFTPDIFNMQQFGGISRYFVRLAEELIALQHDAHVVAPFHINHHLRDSTLGAKRYCLNDKTRFSGKLTRASNSIALQFQLFSAHPHIVHSTYFRRFPPLVTRATRIVTVLDLIDEFYHSNHPIGIELAQLKRRAVNEADLVLCISENTRQDLIRHLGISPDKTRVTYLAADTPPAATRSDHPLNGTPYILYVGSRYGYKNFDSLIAAYAQSSARRNKIKLVLFGSSPLNSEEIAQLDRFSISQNDVLYRPGSDDALYHYYRHAELFIYPSRYEGFGIPPLEAMSVGCPVACSNTSSIPEVVGDAAFLFDPNSVGSIIETLEIALHDTEQRKRKIDSGFSQFEKFSWRQCAQDTLDAYHLARGKAS